jgi:DNA-binding NtrC family response regulator
MQTDTMSLTTVLNLDPVAEDRASLEAIFGRSDWKLISSPSEDAALEVLRANRIPLLFCESDVRPGVWQELLEKLGALPNAPYLVVTSRLADDRLWAEALNLGAYDVLSKPFDHTEVVRITGAACSRWTHRTEVPIGRFCAA